MDRPQDEKLLTEICEMGFDPLVTRKALMAGAGNAEAAVQWVLDHEKDAHINDPIALVKSNTLGAAPTNDDAPVAKSIKCVETGRLFRNMAEAQAYAERTGKSDFEECTEEKKPLTEEEKSAKIKELKQLAAVRRAEREGLEKIEDVDREKKRRETGATSIKTKEELERAKRTHELQKAKREKEFEKRERERLRAEIAKDKAERRARGGKLAGRLGVDGYAPSIDNNDARRDAKVPAPSDDGDCKMDDASAAAGRPKHARVDVSQLAKGKVVAEGSAKPADPPSVTVDKSVASLKKYKVGGDGGTALKTLGAYLRNATLKGGQDAKFLAIPTDNAAFKQRVAPLVGGIALLKAVGFVKNDETAKMELAPETRAANLPLLQASLIKLEAAYAEYMAQH